MKIAVKSFNELTKQELYEILRLRSEIFVVEQNCVYQDIDNKDQKALHVIGTNHTTIVAYTRIFRKGDYAEQASIGRVLVKKTERKHGYGIAIMKASIEAVEEHFGETTIHVSAQLYLECFYSSLGFDQVGDGYLEDNIPHIGMIRTKNPQ